MGQQIISILAALSVFLHTVLGCCAHHAHAHDGPSLPPSLHDHATSLHHHTASGCGQTRAWEHGDADFSSAESGIAGVRSSGSWRLHQRQSAEGKQDDACCPGHEDSECSEGVCAFAVPSLSQWFAWSDLAGDGIDLSIAGLEYRGAPQVFASAGPIVHLWHPFSATLRSHLALRVLLL